MKILKNSFIDSDLIIRARAPLRLGLAGGGTDIESYSSQYGGYVLNATIGRYAYATLRLLKSSQVLFLASDLGVRNEFAIVNGALSGEDRTLNLHLAIYDYFIKNYNEGEVIPLELQTFCEAPAGSGLGSSSTLVVVMIKAYVELLNLPFDDYQVAKLAYYIERVVCGLDGGMQDQYAASFGGFNFIEFYENQKVVVNPLRIKNWVTCELEASLVIFHTGTSRESSGIIADQNKNIKNKEIKVLDSMHLVKQEAVNMKNCLLKGDFPGIVDCMLQGWKNKKNLSSFITNSYIEDVYESAISSGALAGKVSGAGGGGYMLFFVPPVKRLDVIRELSKFNGAVESCQFTSHGTQSWKLA